MQHLEYPVSEFPPNRKSRRFLESTLFNHFIQSVKLIYRMDIEMDIEDIWDP